MGTAIRENTLLSRTGCPATPNQSLRPAEGRTADSEKKRKHDRISLKQIKACQVCLATPSLAPGRRPHRRQRKKQKHNRISLKQIKVLPGLPRRIKPSLAPRRKPHRRQRKKRKHDRFSLKQIKACQVCLATPSQSLHPAEGRPAGGKKRKHDRISLEQIKACQVCLAASSQSLRPDEGHTKPSLAPRRKPPRRWQKNESTVAFP